MSRQEIMERVARYFGVEPDDYGEYDINSYEWSAGCYTGCKNEYDETTFMSLAEFVKCIEREFDDCFYDDDED